MSATTIAIGTVSTCHWCGEPIEYMGQSTWHNDGATRCPEDSLPTPRPTGRNLFHRPASRRSVIAGT